MNSVRAALLALVFVFMATVPAWAFPGDIAPARNSWANDPPMARQFEDPGGFRWEGARGVGPGQDVTVRYAGSCVRDSDPGVLSDCDSYTRCAYEGDVLRCDRCAVSDRDLCDRCVVSNYGSCVGCTSEYRCDLCHCGWVR
jgi:hypothetical protein